MNRRSRAHAKTGAGSTSPDLLSKESLQLAAKKCEDPNCIAQILEDVPGLCLHLSRLRGLLSFIAIAELGKVCTITVAAAQLAKPHIGSQITKRMYAEASYDLLGPTGELESPEAVFRIEKAAWDFFVAFYDKMRLSGTWSKQDGYRCHEVFAVLLAVLRRAAENCAARPGHQADRN